MPRSTLTEARQVAEATPVAGQPGRFLIELITPGWGSSGYYSAEVLEQAAADRIFPTGLHMYLDHPTESEHMERPERSVRDLAAALAEDARWNGEALVAEATVFGGYREVLDQMAESIGVSIRAAAEVTEGGEAEGRRGRIIDRLVEGISADYVTHAGRGGRIAQVLESARPVQEARNVGQWIESRIHRDFTITADDMAGEGRLTREERIGLSSAIGDALAAFVSSLEANQPQLYTRDLWEDPHDTVAAAIETHRRGVRLSQEATANDRREQLDTAVRDTHATGEDAWAWVRDFDEDRGVLWFERGGTDAGTFQQSFTVADDDATVTLTGDPVEVSVRTTYVPVNPAGRNTTQEAKMPEIAESELQGLREAAGRVQTLESERDAAVQRAETAESERDTLRETEARRERHTIIRRIVGEAAEAAGVTLDDDQSAGIATRAVLNDDRTVNESATRTEADRRCAAIKEAQGHGRPRGLGSTTPPAPDGVSESDLDALDDAVFGQIQEA